MHIAVVGNNKERIKSILNQHMIDFFETSKDFRKADLKKYEAILVNYLIGIDSVDGVNLIKAIQNKTSVDMGLIFDSYNFCNCLKNLKVSRLFFNKELSKKLPEWMDYIENKMAINTESQKVMDSLKVAHGILTNLYGT